MNAIEVIEEALFDVNENHKRLVKACEFALKTYNDMTSENFSLGKDKEAREMLQDALSLNAMYFDNNSDLDGVCS